MAQVLKAAMDLAIGEASSTDRSSNSASAKQPPQNRDELIAQQYVMKNMWINLYLPLNYTDSPIAVVVPPRPSYRSVVGRLGIVSQRKKRTRHDRGHLPAVLLIKFESPTVFPSPNSDVVVFFFRRFIFFPAEAARRAGKGKKTRQKMGMCRPGTKPEKCRKLAIVCVCVCVS